MKKIDDEKLRRSAEAFHGSGFLIIYMIIRTVWTLLRQLKEKEMNLQIDERKNTAYIKLSGLLSKEVIILSDNSIRLIPNVIFSLFKNL